MGCTSSKKVYRTSSFQENLNKPFPRVAAIPIIEDFLLTNNHEQFVALIRKTNSFAKKVPATKATEIIPFSINTNNEGEGDLRGNSGIVRLDLRLGNSLKEEKSEKHKATKEELEEHKVTEDKPEIINTWELLEGLEDGETEHTSQKPIQNSDLARVSTTTGRSKSLGCFHTLEEYDALFSRSNNPLWARNSERDLYHLGDKSLEIVSESTLSSQYRRSSLPSPTANPIAITPVVIEWKEDSNDEDNCVLGSSVLQACSEQSDTENEVSSQENNNIAEIVPENSSSEEINHVVEKNARNKLLGEVVFFKNQSTEPNSSKRSLHERARVNDMGGINIPSSPDFSAVGSLKEWLRGGENFYFPGVSTAPSFGSYGLGDQWSNANSSHNFGHFATNETENEINSFLTLETDKLAENIIGSGVRFDSSVSAIEKENWDYPLFEPELLASFEKALEQLCEEEKCLLRQMDESSNFPSRDCNSEDSEDGLEATSREEGIPVQTGCPSSDEKFSVQIRRISENPQEILVGTRLLSEL